MTRMYKDINGGLHFNKTSAMLANQWYREKMDKYLLEVGFDITAVND